MKFPNLPEHVRMGSGFNGYTFFTEDGTKVGGAASTMHCASIAQRKANSLNKAIYVYLSQASRWHFHAKVNPKEKE